MRNFNDKHAMSRQRSPAPQHAGRSDMILDSYILTPHAELRMAQRGLSRGDVRYILRYGQLYFGAAAVFYFLGRDDIPAGDGPRMDRLQGAAVVTSFDGYVLTVWRNRKDGMKTIRRKLEYSVAHDRVHTGAGLGARTRW